MSGEIWAVAEHREGELHRGSLEVMAFCQQLGDAVGGEVRAVVVGSQEAGSNEAAAKLGTYASVGVLSLVSPGLRSYAPATYVEALSPVVQARSPAIVVLPHTYQTVEMLPRLALRFGGALVPEATSFRLEKAQVVWRRPILQGKVHAEVRVKSPSEAPTFVSLQSGAVRADQAAPGAAEIEVVDPEQAAEGGREVLGVETAGGEEVDLSAAEVVVAVGRGVGEPDKLQPIRELATALGGELGASRPVVDAGWLGRSLQIGSSGQTVAPRLYLALGISGAIQHVVGMRGAQCVVAINKDATAPIFQIARYGVVGDLHELVPALTEALEERKNAH